MRSGETRTEGEVRRRAWARAIHPDIRGRRLSATEREALLIRSGGAKNPTYFPMTPQSLADFDALVFLGTVGYCRSCRSPAPSKIPRVQRAVSQAPARRQRSGACR